MVNISEDSLTGKKLWTITINRTSMFDKVSVRTVYLNNSLPQDKQSASREMNEGDMIMFYKYFRDAVSDIVMILERNMTEIYSDTNFMENTEMLSLFLTPTETMPDSIAIPLSNYVEQFIETYILSKWLMMEAQPLGVTEEKDEVEKKLLSAIHHRKSGRVIRRVDPIF